MKMRISDSEAKEEFNKKGLEISFIDLKVQNIKLHYAKIGNDTLPTLFFVHGSPGSWSAFKKYMADKDLLQKYRIISIDRPGFGFSNFGDAYNLTQQSDLIIEIIKKEYKTKPFHLIGHSIGGPVIVKLAQDYPKYYKSLCILAGSISPFEEPKENWRYVMQVIPLRYLLPGAMRTSNHEIIYFKKDLFVLDKNYNLLTMPVHFIHGDKDPLVSAKNVDYGIKKLAFNPKVSKQILPNANHFIPWLKYEEIKQYLLKLE